MRARCEAILKEKANKKLKEQIQQLYLASLQDDARVKNAQAVSAYIEGMYAKVIENDRNDVIQSYIAQLYKKTDSSIKDEI